MARLGLIQTWVAVGLICGTAASLAVAKPGPGTVTMRFVQTELPIVLRAMAGQVGFDLVVSPGVEAKVDVDLKNVEWETALAAIASANQLTYQWRDNVLVVMAGGNDGGGALAHEVVNLRYADPGAVKALLNSVIQPPGKAELLQIVPVAGAPMTGPVTANIPPVLVVTETPQNMASILSLIDSLDVARPQFEIEVKFVETSLDDKMGVGFNWPTTIGASIAGEPTSTSTTTEERPAAQYNIPDEKIWRFGTLSVDQLSGFMQLLNQKGKSKLLSDPRVTVVESERAVMRVATTIPVQTLNRFSEGGTIQDIVSFQDLDVGITLAVTPRLNDGDNITLEVEPIVEEITGFTGPADNQRPITSKRTVRTTVRVKDNQTVVIGGLVRETDITTKSKLFLLGDIPILGELFTHRKTEKQKTDLMIFITPRLLVPVAAN